MVLRVGLSAKDVGIAMYLGDMIMIEYPAGESHCRAETGGCDEPRKSMTVLHPPLQDRRQLDAASAVVDPRPE